MLKLIFLVWYLVMVALDAWLTEKRMREAGVEVELNPIIKYLCRKFGLRWGIVLGLFIPSTALAIVTWPSDLLFGAIVGFRACFAVLQALSLRS